MKQIPVGWMRSTIGEITLPVGTVETAGTGDRKIQYIDIGSIDNQRNRIAAPKRINLASAPSRARQIVKSGDVLFATVRPYLRNIAQVPESLSGEIASTGFAVLRPAEGIEPGYLFYRAISQDFVAALTGEQYGVSYPAVNDDQVRAQSIEIPSTTEQRRIVAKIEELFSELDKAVETLTAAREQLKVYRQSVLKHAFEGKLNGGHAGGLKSWKVASVGEITADSLLGIVRSAQQQNNEGRGVSYIKMDRLNMDGYVSTEPRVFVHAGGEEIRRYGIQQGDILFNTRNSRELVGKVALVRANPDGPTVFNNNIMRIRTIDGALPAFVTYQMCGPEFRRRMEQVKKATTSVAAVYGKDLWPLPLILPPLQEQREIVRLLETKLEATDVAEAEIDAAHKRAISLRQLILGQAFLGQLVAQNPMDEPAAVLLERIRAERIDFGSKKRLNNRNRKKETA